MSERLDVIQKVEAIQISERLSDERIGRILNCSGATWHLVRKGKYTGNIDKFIGRARAWLDDRAANREVPSPDFVETNIGLRILKICKNACDVRDMALILTRAGCGKTTALEEFARRRKSQAILVRGSQYVSTKIAVIREIARGLGLKTTLSKTFESLAGEVREKLADAYSAGVGTPICILVDQAHELQALAIDLLRNLHDDPDCRAIVVLAATWHLKNDFLRLRTLIGGFEQITSRIGSAYTLAEDAPIDEGDVRLVAQATVKAQGFDGPLPRETLKYLSGLAAEDGALRKVVKRLRACLTLSEATGKDATYSVHELDRAAEIMGRPSQLMQRPPAAPKGETYPGSAPQGTMARTA